MLKVTFEAATPKELIAQLQDFCAMYSSLKSAPAAPAPAPVSNAAAPVKADSEPKIEPEKRKPGRPPKSKAADIFEDAPAAELIPEPAAPAPAAPAAAPVTKQQVTEALSKVNGTKGLPAARALLLEFGTDRLSNVPPEKYAELIAKCEAALA